MTTLAQALAAARAAGVARLDAQLLLAHQLGRDRAWLIAHDDAPLSAAAQAAFAAAVQRRAAGEPLAYLVGAREFHGLSLAVDARVLVPRPETEGLVDWALQRLAALPVGTVPEVVDLGCGSGAIALAIAAAAPAAKVVAADVSADALAVCAANAQRLGLQLEMHHGPWWQPLGAARFHVAVSNPPYIAEGDPHLAALGHEPRLALTAGGDGLEALHAIIDAAADHLHADGWLLLEHGHDQAGAVRQRLAARDFVEIETRADLAGLPRCSGGRRPGG